MKEHVARFVDYVTTEKGLSPRAHISADFRREGMDDLPDTVRLDRPHMLNCVVLVLMLSIVASCSGQVTHANGENRALTTVEANGGSVVTNLGYGIQVNKGSSLQRRWFVVNDDSCPMQLNGAGINTTYRSSSDYSYVPVGSANFREATTAFEIRFLLFDVWGEHAETLDASKIVDAQGEITLKDIGTWRASENEVSGMFTVIAFVASVRKPDGTVWQYDAGSLLQQIAKIKVKLTEKELTPEREKPKN